MGKIVNRARQRALDEHHVHQHKETVAGRSMALQHVLGYATVTGPFIAPPPLPSSADTTSAPTAPIGHSVPLDDLYSPSAGTERSPARKPLPGWQLGGATSTTLLPKRDNPLVLPGPQAHLAHAHLPAMPKMTRQRVRRVKCHPDLLTFKFPAASPPAPEVENKNPFVGVQGQKRRYRTSSVEMVVPINEEEESVASPNKPSAARNDTSSDFDIYEDADAESDDSAVDHQQQHRSEPVDSSVLSDISSKHEIDTSNDNADNPSQSIPQASPTPRVPPQQPATQSNVIPSIEKLFEQWFRFGVDNWEGRRLLQPRQIPIHSVTARTLPCLRDGSSSDADVIVEKPVKLFTIVADQDAAQVKMFEIEVVSSEPQDKKKLRKALLNIVDSEPYHETSSADPNIWTVLFIREKPPRFSVKGLLSKKLDEEEEEEIGTDVRVAKRRREAGIQGLDVEDQVPPSTMFDEDAFQNSWQMMAWPSAHVTKVMQVLGPVRDETKPSSSFGGDQETVGSRAAHQGKSAGGRTPLAPKIIQVRQKHPPSSSRRRSKPHDGRVHLKDARAYAEYRASALARADQNKQFCSDRGASQVVEDRENINKMPPLRPINFVKVDAIAGCVQTVQQMSADLSSLVIDDDAQCGENSVKVHEMQRLTCLRFQRAGEYPLLTGKGVDLNYWNTFCEYFGRGEAQIEVLSPANGEPVVLSEEEQRRRRGSGGARNNALAQGGNKSDTGNAEGTSKDGLRLGGRRTLDTPIPEHMRIPMDEDDKRATDQPDSTPLLQREQTPYGNGIQDGSGLAHKHGKLAGTAYEFLPGVRNTPSSLLGNKLTFRLPQQIHDSSAPNNDNNNNAASPAAAALPQHSRNNSAATTTHPDVVGNPSHNNKNNSRPPTISTNPKPNGNAPGPAPRGWQAELLAALASHRAPAWHDWPTRSPHYQARAERILDTHFGDVGDALDGDWAKELHILGDRRADRDAHFAYDHYKAKTEQRAMRLRQEEKWKFRGRAEVERKLRAWEAAVQPEESMRAVRAEQVKREFRKGRMEKEEAKRVLKGIFGVKSGDGDGGGKAQKAQGQLRQGQLRQGQQLPVKPVIQHQPVQQPVIQQRQMQQQQQMMHCGSHQQQQHQQVLYNNNTNNIPGSHNRQQPFHQPSAPSYAVQNQQQHQQAGFNQNNSYGPGPGHGHPFVTNGKQLMAPQHLIALDFAQQHHVAYGGNPQTSFGGRYLWPLWCKHLQEIGQGFVQQLMGQNQQQVIMGQEFSHQQHQVATDQTFNQQQAVGQDFNQQMAAQVGPSLSAAVDGAANYAFWQNYGQRTIAEASAVDDEGNEYGQDWY